MTPYFNHNLCNSSEEIRITRTCCYILWAPSILYPNSWKGLEVVKKQIRASCKWFSHVKEMTAYYKPNLCNSSKGIKKIGTRCCTLRTLGIFHPSSCKILGVVRKKNTSKLYMVSTCENLDFLFWTQFMQLIQGNQKNRNLLLYFTDPWYLASQLMKNIRSSEKTITCKL